MIKKVNDADLFSQPPLLIFTKGANIIGGHCIHWHLSCLHDERNQEWGAEELHSLWGLFISLLVWKGFYSCQKYNFWVFVSLGDKM